eukprot:scaffold177820_cov34-Prasinocladus_malaysianus.AAC.2
MSTRTGLSTGVQQSLRTTGTGTKSVYLGTVRYELLLEYRYVTVSLQPAGDSGIGRTNQVGSRKCRHPEWSHFISPKVWRPR